MKNGWNRACVINSSLRVERRKRGNAQQASSSSHEAEGDRELSSAGVRTRGRRPRILTARESYRAREWRPVAVGRRLSPCEITFSSDHLRPSTANFTRVCMTAFVSRCVYFLSAEDIEIGGLSDFNYCWHAVVGATGEGVQVEGGAGVRGAGPVGGAGGGAPRPSRNELQMFHKKILSRNETWFVKIRRQMADYNKTIIKHIFKPKMTEIIKNILKPKMTDCNETIIKNIFKHKYF